MTQEETLRSSSGAKLWSLWQHPYVSIKVLGGSLGRHERREDGKDKRVKLLSMSAGWVVSYCRFTHVFQSCFCQQCSYTYSQVFFLVLHGCVNPPLGDVSQSRTVCGRCRSITAAVLSDETPDSRGQLKLTILIELNHVWRRFYFGQEKNTTMSCENISGWKQELLSNNRSFPSHLFCGFPSRSMRTVKLCYTPSISHPDWKRMDDDWLPACTSAILPLLPSQLWIH